MCNSPSRAIDERAADEKQQDFESSRAGEEYSLAAVETAEGRLARAVAALEKSRADLDVARSHQRVAEAAKTTSRILAEYIEINSPYDGVVTRRSFHRGAFIRSASDGGDVPVLSVARTDLMRVIVYVPDRDVPYVDRGDKVLIRFDALPGDSFPGTVARYSNVETSANRTMRVEVELPNPHGRLREGMYGALTILLEPPANVLTIPSQALVEMNSLGDGRVFVARDGRARMLAVRTGKDNGRRVEIQEGLSENDTIVLSYSGSLDDGDLVETQRAAAHRANGKVGDGT